MNHILIHEFTNHKKYLEIFYLFVIFIKIIYFVVLTLKLLSEKYQIQTLIRKIIKKCLWYRYR